MEKYFEQYTDYDVIQKVLSDDLIMFSILVHRYYPDLYKLGRCFQFTHGTTQSLAEAAFVDAYLGLKKRKGSSPFRLCLLTLMLRRCRREQFSETFASGDLSRLSDETPLVFSGMPVVNKKDRPVSSSEKAILEIPEKYRLAYVLVKINDLSAGEAAPILEVSEKVVIRNIKKAESTLINEFCKTHIPRPVFDCTAYCCNAILADIMSSISRVPLSD
jgi:RNA polymerase sigma-70 factor (ECF subfamily)